MLRDSTLALMAGMAVFFKPVCHSLTQTASKQRILYRAILADVSALGAQPHQEKAATGRGPNSPGCLRDAAVVLAQMAS
jgi:hypothetical protein